MVGILIREEQPGDEEPIDTLTIAAFAPMSFSDGSEAPIIKALRQSGQMALSLVAVSKIGNVVGHIAFSAVTIDNQHNDWFGLGPIAVDLPLQRKGIGRSLVERGLELLKQRGAAGAALIGNPDIYRRYGFVSSGLLTYGDLPVAYVQQIAFCGPEAEGELKFASSFEPRNYLPYAAKL